MEGTIRRIWEPIDFTIYFNFIKWPILFALILEIGFRYFAMSLGSGLLYDQMELISWAIRLFTFAIIALRSAKSFGYSAVIAAISGVLSGFTVGFVISLFRFYDGFKFWKFFNIITETTTVAIVGSLVAIFIIFISSIKNN